ncbi:uncharacterized protein LOC124645082 [Helicoverpa zea]|uniref:uncharacterized protein LOC124645082 n=1 Tax=Helicoverpa zea TaxID=7113 RepID=UPI001F5A8211|nr:uncharacterized protein LOC124645082 [Helicoverpa zea]
MRIKNPVRAEGACESEPLKPSQDSLTLFLNALKSVGHTNSLDKLGNIHNTVPEFDPCRKEQTMTMWLHKVNECATIYGWTEKQLIHFALPKLRGVAQRWYEGQSSVLFSWEEWQTKLQSAFPSDENYGQTLCDMLAKRARFGECLETYFYDKLAMINRCGIVGRKAVDCLLHGIDDRSVRLGAEAVQYDDPDKLLAYFRNSRNIKPTSDRKNVHKGQNYIKTSEASIKPGNKGQRCYNCKQEGHILARCPLPIKKCSKCSRVGHDAEQCFAKLLPPPDSNKKVNKVDISDHNDAGDKYLKIVSVDGISFNAFIDFGSECCSIRVSDFKRIGDTYDTNNLPHLRGFGGSLVQVLGKRLVNVMVDEVEAEVELLIVPDNAMQVPVMIGQTFTEQRHITVFKTSDTLTMLRTTDDLVINRKIRLFCKDDLSVFWYLVSRGL